MKLLHRLHRHELRCRGHRWAKRIEHRRHGVRWHPAAPSNDNAFPDAPSYQRMRAWHEGPLDR